MKGEIAGGSIVLKEIMGENFLDLGKGSNIQSRSLVSPKQCEVKDIHITAHQLNSQKVKKIILTAPRRKLHLTYREQNNPNDGEYLIRNQGGQKEVAHNCPSCQTTVNSKCCILQDIFR